MFGRTDPPEKQLGKKLCVCGRGEGGLGLTIHVLYCSSPKIQNLVYDSKDNYKYKVGFEMPSLFIYHMSHRGMGELLYICTCICISNQIIQLAKKFGCGSLGTPSF